MLMSIVQATLACLVAQTVCVYAYPHGAPEKACKTMIPTSHGNSTATGKSPYQIKLTATETKYLYNFTLSGVGGAQFKGFLIQARIKGALPKYSPVGFFKNPPPSAKVLCVDPRLGNSVTQTNNTVKSSVSLQWDKPRPNVCGQIQFHLTVVRGGAPNTKIDAADYFMDILNATFPSGSKEIVAKSILY